MFKLPYSGIEKSFTENKLLTKEIIQDFHSNFELYGTQVTISFADRLSIFLATYPPIVEKIQSLILQNLPEEEIIRKIINNLLNKEFGSFDNYELVRICIAVIISVTSKCKIDYPFEIIDINFNQSLKTVRLKFTPLISFLNQKSIILFFCGLSYILEELHINEEFHYNAEEINSMLVHLNKIEQSSLWAKDELIYLFLIRLNFLIDFEDDITNQINYTYLLYVLKSIYNEIDYFKFLCKFFALNRWNALFQQSKSYSFRKDSYSKNFLKYTKPFNPVLATKSKSGFRIITGKSRNTGFGTIGVSEVLLKVLNFLSLGDQIKLEFPFKNYQVQVVDSIEGPYVELLDKSCIRIHSIEDYQKYQNIINKILTLGDILIDDFDIPFIFNKSFIGQTHITWTNHAISYLKNINETQISYLENLFNIKMNSSSPSSFLSFFQDFLKHNEHKISCFISVELFKNFKIPIHPNWSPRWDVLTNKDWRLFRVWIKKTRYWESSLNNQKIHQIEGPIDDIILNVLREGEISFSIQENKIVISEFGSIFYFLFLDKSNDLGENEPAENVFSPIRFLQNSSKIAFDIEEKFRLNSSLNSSNTYYIDSIMESIHGFYTEPLNDNERSYIKSRIDRLKINLELNQISFLKGQGKDVSKNKRDELLDKTIIRAKHQLPIFKDGLIHFSLINSPLRTFKPIEINCNIKQLNELGYYFDIFGKPLTSLDQEILLCSNDVIIPEILIDDILRVMNFINDELKLIYGRNAFYDLSNGKKSVIGLNIIGINKNYSVGIYGRIIGFSSVPVCFATPIWHLSKGSYCDGDMTDSFVLDLDCFLNLDLSQIMSKIGMFRGIPIFTQVEPDSDISLAIVTKVISESKLKFEKLLSYDGKNSEFISKLLIEDIKDSNQFNLFGNYFNISNIATSVNENNFKDIIYPIAKLTYVLENEKFLATIDITEIFNSSIAYFLSNYILPEIRNSFINSFSCVYCGFKYEIIYDSHCPNCGKPFNLVEKFEYIKKRFNEIKEIIDQYNMYKLNDVTKDLLVYSELQLNT